MRKWALADSTRELMVAEIFEAGYGSTEELKHMIRWTRQEMLELCDDMGLLSLFKRYVTWHTNGKDKEVFIREVEAEIALDDLLTS
jgi:hypothetical protein